VLDGDPVPFLQKGAEPLPNFRPISIVAKRLDASIATRLMEVSFSPGEFVLDGDPAPYPKRGGRSSLPNFKGIEVESFEIGSEVWVTSGYS